MIIYTSYVYIWYDTIAKLFYIGGHYGRTNDSYICSSPTMKCAYKKRPHTFKFRVLEYVTGSTYDLRKAEQRWLDMIKEDELLITQNVYRKTVKYYNVKKNSTGGNGIGTNKGKSNIGGWNRGKKFNNWHTNETKQKMSEIRKEWWEKKKLVDSVAGSTNKTADSIA